MGTELAPILANRAGRLSKEILAREPNMAFLSGLSDKEKAMLMDLGWQIVWEPKHGVMLWRPPSRRRESGFRCHRSRLSKPLLSRPGSR